LNALVDLEDDAQEAPVETKANKERSFPTAIVVVLSLLIALLSAATCVVCYRSQKVEQPSAQVDE